MEIQETIINKLTVLGCSYSDRSRVEKNYCDYLSSKLEIKGESLAAGCGSNPRIWRLVLSGIRSNTINKNTLLVIQYSEIFRKEFWSKFYDPNLARGKNSYGNGHPLREEFNGGDLIKYKFGASAWQPTHYEKSLFKNLEKNFLDEKYENEIFKNNHYSLLNTLENHQINTIFLNTHYINGSGLLDFNNFKYSTVFDLVNPLNFPQEEDGNCLNGDDCSHLSKKGHISLSNMLFDFINNEYLK